MFAKDVELLNELYSHSISEMNIGPRGDNISTTPSVAKIQKVETPSCGGGCEEEERNNIATHEDTNAGMVKQSLFRLAKLSAMLHDLVSRDTAEPWVLSKVTEALNHIESVYGYMDYEQYRQQVEQDIEGISEETEQDLYDSISSGGETVIGRLRDVLSTESRKNIEQFIYEAITFLEKK